MGFCHHNYKGKVRVNENDIVSPCTAKGERSAFKSLHGLKTSAVKDVLIVPTLERFVSG